MSIFVDTLVSTVVDGLNDNCTPDAEKAEFLDRLIG